MDALYHDASTDSVGADVDNTAVLQALSDDQTSILAHSINDYQRGQTALKQLLRTLYEQKSGLGVDLETYAFADTVAAMAWVCRGHRSYADSGRLH